MQHFLRRRAVRLQVKDKCDRILNQLDGPVSPSQPPAKADARSLVGRVILVPPASLGWSSKWSAALWHRRRRCFNALLCCALLSLLLLGAVLAATLLRRAGGSLIEDATLQAVHAPATPTAPGRVMLDVTVALSAPGTIWYAVFGAEHGHVDAQDVVQASSATGGSQASGAASACGKLFVPMLQDNHTFTIADAALSSECDGSMANPSLQHNCLRCPELRAQASVKVLLPCDHLTFYACMRTLVVAAPLPLHVPGQAEAQIVSRTLTVHDLRHLLHAGRDRYQGTGQV